MFELKTALIVEEVMDVNEGGWCNLALTAKALDADQIPYNKINYDELAKYQCIIVVDNKDYRLFGDVAQKIRAKYPKMFMGWHQESEVSNIMRRHKIHGDDRASEESWCISTLKVWESVQVCDFIICHNDRDYSTSFYHIYSGGKPCFALGPFLPIDKVKHFWKPREKKEKKICFGMNYGWREAGLQGYIVVGQDKFNGFELLRKIRGNPESPQEIYATKMIDENFYKKKVNSTSIGGRIALVDYFSTCYLAINLREPTACRTNAACAASGTPMIGNEQSDVQNLIYPDLCVNKYDLKRISFLLEALIMDTAFYDRCVAIAANNLWLIGEEQCGNNLRDAILKIREGKW